VFDELSGDVEIVPVQLRKIGKLNVKLPQSTPVSGKPEAITNEAELNNPDDSLERYYQVLVRSEYDYSYRGNTRFDLSVMQTKCRVHSLLRMDI